MQALEAANSDSTDFNPVANVNVVLLHHLHYRAQLHGKRAVVNLAMASYIPWLV